MNVKARLWRKLRKERLHMTLIDPADDRGAAAAKLARAAADAGSDAIMVGGSTGYSPSDLDGTVGAIKAAVNLPVILFPTSAGLLSGRADAIYFMIMMNSRDIRYLSREQMRGAPAVRKLKIEPISMGYIIIEPGMRVGKVGQAEVVPRADVKTASAYALAAQYLGMECVYLEAGSGAPRPVPPRMVAHVRATVRIPLLVGGGIRSPSAAAAAARAGGDIIVTGTVAERARDPAARLSKIVEAVKEA